MTSARPLEGLRLTFDVLAGGSERRELERGYALAFPRGRGWEAKLAELDLVLAATHPDLVATVLDEPGAARLWLRLEGPDGTRAYLQNLFDMLARAEAPWRTRLAWRLRRATSTLRALPDFLVIGAARCGTTSLYAQLAAHPGVAPPFKKEVGYFDRGWRFGDRWYRAHFPLRARMHGRQTGEATPDYLFSPHAPRRVRDLLPAAKCIVLLRDPVVRAESQYHLEVRQGYETLSFEDALDQEAERLEGELERALADEHYFFERRHFFSYQARGLYAEQLERWFDVLPREQFLVLSLESFHLDPDSAFRRVTEFLGLSRRELPSFERLHTVPRKAMEPAVQARLAKLFAPHNERLFELLGERFPWASG